MSVLILLIATFLGAINLARNVVGEINAYATRNAPTVTMTHKPYTATPTLRPTRTSLPSPTFTATLRPTFTRTPLPTYTKTSRPTFTYTPRPTMTRIPSPTIVLPPEPSKMSASLTFKPTKGKSPITLHFNAENSYIEYNNGSRKECFQLGCEYKWSFPDGFVVDFPSASRVSFRFTRPGTFSVVVTACWNGYCDDATYSITIN